NGKRRSVPLESRSGIFRRVNCMRNYRHHLQLIDIHNYNQNQSSASYVKHSHRCMRTGRCVSSMRYTRSTPVPVRLPPRNREQTLRCDLVSAGNGHGDWVLMHSMYRTGQNVIGTLLHSVSSFQQDILSFGSRLTNYWVLHVSVLPHDHVLSSTTCDLSSDGAISRRGHCVVWIRDCIGERRQHSRVHHHVARPEIESSLESDEANHQIAIDNCNR
ncbi:hypothetical protein PENTCL1PPCAC_14876, partial [Pristionchus entomophagus]